MYEDEIPIGRAKDLRGQKFGRLTVIKRAPNKGKRPAWECQCDCGNSVIVRANHLTSGLTKSCGCSRRLDLTGQHFGKLVALEPTNQRIGCSVVWKCQCDCGNIVYIEARSLSNGNTKSCGCLSKLDLTGQHFGKLTAIKPTEKRSNNCSIVWKCQCDCGNITYVEATNLSRGHNQSCGCLTSKGEMIITNILQRNNIIYEVQKIFETCKYENSDGRPRFDFYVNNSYLIEYDGEQHFKSVGYFGGDEQFIIQQQRDNYKTQWCRENNIPLIRIPYTKLDTLCIEDLMLETTQFRVV